MLKELGIFINNVGKVTGQTINKVLSDKNENEEKLMGQIARPHIDWKINIEEVATDDLPDEVVVDDENLPDEVKHLHSDKYDMNELETAIANCPYSTDFFEMRNNMLNIVGAFIEKEECQWYHVYEKQIDNTKFYSIVFYIFECLYIWSDLIVDGCIESSQLDKPYNDYMAEVLYCTVENAPPVAPILFKWIDENDIIQLR